jgi:hypothetical protein
VQQHVCSSLLNRWTLAGIAPGGSERAGGVTIAGGIASHFPALRSPSRLRSTIHPIYPSQRCPKVRRVGTMQSRVGLRFVVAGGVHRADADFRPVVRSMTRTRDVRGVDHTNST